MEIRDRIFRLAVGNHHIHLEHQTYCPRDPLTICGPWYFTGPNPPCDRERTPGRSHYDWGTFLRHSRFSSARARSMEPNILNCERIPALWLVCRQLHTETALYLYSLNLFSFANYWVMRGWLQALSPIQLHNVQYLCMSGKTHEIGMLVLPEDISITFTGLKEVYVHSEAADERLEFQDRRRRPLMTIWVPSVRKCRHTLQFWQKHAPGCKVWVVESHAKPVLAKIEDWCRGKKELMDSKPKTAREIISFNKRAYRETPWNFY